MKSSPTGVRFDKEQLEFIKSREKLLSCQQVVSFLLKSYWDAGHIKRNPFIAQEQIEAEKPIIIKKSFDYFAAQIRGLEQEEDCKDFVMQVQSSDILTLIQKQTLVQRLKNKWL